MDFTKIYQENYSQMYACALGYMKNREDAEDAVQEAFLNASQALDSFHGDSSISTWLISICRYTCTNILNANRAKKRGGGQVVSSDTDVDWFDQQDLSTPDAIMEAEETEQSIHNQLEGMRPELVEAATLRLVDQLSYKEIAGKMGVPVGTVKSWVSRVRNSIMHTISPQ